MVLEDISRVRADLKFRGAQGTTGTQASFMEVFSGDGEKIDKLNEILCAKSGFPSCYSISTQTVSLSFTAFSCFDPYPAPDAVLKQSTNLPIAVYPSRGSARRECSFLLWSSRSADHWRYQTSSCTERDRGKLIYRAKLHLSNQR